MEVTLHDITLALMQEYDRSFSPDPDLFMDMNRFTQYHYDPAVTQARYERYRQAGNRRVFLVMTEGKPVGEIMLKHIDMEKRQAELSIHLQNDTVKNRGIGTQAERLLLVYAFDTLHLETVLADTVLKNTRSQHVLEKVGFSFVREEGIFKYYRITRDAFTAKP